MEGDASIQFNFEGDPESLRGTRKVKSRVSRNKKASKYTYSVPVVSKPSTAPTLKLLIIQRTDDLNRGMIESKPPNHFSSCKVLQKYVIFNVGEAIEDQTLVINEENVEDWFGKKLKIVLERVDDVKKENAEEGKSLESESHLDTFCSNENHIDSSETASKLLYDDNSLDVIVKEENVVIGEEDTEGISESKYQTMSSTTELEEENKNNVECNNVVFSCLQVKLETDLNKGRAKLESEGSSSSLLEEEGNLETNQNEGGVQLEFKDCSSSLLEEEGNYALCKKTGTIYFSNLSDHEISSSLVIEDPLEFKEGSVQKSTNEINKEVKLQICLACTINFLKLQSLNQHIDLSNDALFSCAQCSLIKSKTKNDLVDHSEIHPEKSKIKGDLVDRSKIHSEKKLFECPHCIAKFFNVSCLDNHVRTHTPKETEESVKFLYCKPSPQNRPMNPFKNPYECSNCTAKFSRKLPLDAHIWCFSNSTRYVCDYCHKTFVRKINLRYHIMTHTGEKPFICTHCNKAFRRHDALRLHMMTRCDKNRYECTHCNEGFCCSEDRSKHIERVHASKRSHECTVCKKVSYSSYTSLINHINRINAGRRPYQCTLCHAAFWEMSSVNSHLRKKHLGENPKKPYDCLLCLRTFTSSSSLNHHIKKRPKKPYGCLLCCRTFTLSSSLNYHIKKQHVDKKPYYQCFQCNAIFYDEKSLNDHFSQCFEWLEAPFFRGCDSRKILKTP